jgi:hypothetical protein
VKGRHIRDEIATRCRYDLIGNGKELDDDRKTRDLCVSFCNVDTHGVEFFFHSIDHAVFSLRDHGGIAACKDCLANIQAIIGAELATKDAQ